jgi:hypothetical protein
MRNGVGEKFEKRSPGTNDTQKTKVLLTLKELGKNKYNDVDFKDTIYKGVIDFYFGNMNKNGLFTELINFYSY